MGHRLAFRSFLLTAMVLVMAVVAVPFARAQANYPVKATVEVRDENGNVVDASVGVKPGQPLKIFSSGWKPKVNVKVEFFSTPVELGSMDADDSGSASGTFAVPNVEAGLHTLRLSGTGIDGQPRVVESPVRVVLATAVLGATLDKTTGSAVSGSSSSSSSAFGRTGAAHVRDLVGIGISLIAVGAVLVLAVRRRSHASAVLP